MKSFNALCLLVTATLVTTFSYAQSVDNTMGWNEFTQPKLSSKPISEEIVGTPYVNPEFQRGNVFKDGALLESNAQLRYNALRDEIEILKQGAPESATKLIVRDEDIYVKILNDTYVYIESDNEEVATGYYLVLIENEKASLYKKQKKEFIEGKKSVNTITRDIPPSFKDDEQLYISFGEGNLVEVPSSRGKKIKLFDSDKKAMKQYVRDNSLNINKDYNFLKLIKYYNSL